MADIAAINVAIGANIDGFERAMRDVQQGVGRLGDGLKTVGAGLTAAITLPLALVGGAAIAAAGKIDSLRRGLQAVTQQQLGEQGVTGLQGIEQAATDTRARLLELRQVAALPGLGFAEAVQGDIRLRAVGLSADLSKRALLAFGNAIATTGGGKGELDRVTVQLGQLSAKGKVLAQDLRPIIEAAPAVATALKKLYGTVDSETISKSLEKQGKSSTEFIDVLTTELAKLPKVTGGLKNALENFADSGEIGLAKLGDSLNKAFNIEGNLGKLGDFITELADKFEALSPATQKTIFVFAGVAAALGPVVFGVGALLAIIPSVVAGLEVLGLAGAAALGPIGIAALTIGAAAALIIANWDELVAYFTTGDGGTVFAGLADSVSNAASEIGRALSALAGGENNLGGLIGAAGILQQLIQGVAVGFGALADVVGGTVGAITRLFADDFAGALAQAKRAVLGLFDPLAALLGFTKANNKSFDAFFGLTDAIKAADEAALAGAASNSALAGSLERVATVVARLTKEQADALARLSKELRDNVSNAQALGREYDFLGAKQSILEGGIKALISAGFSPASRAVRGYAAELRALNALLNDPTGAAAPLAARAVALAPIKPAKLPAKLDAPNGPAYLQPYYDREDAAAQQFADSFRDLLGNGIGAAAAVLGESFGAVISGTASVGDALKSAFTGLLGVMGGFITKFGELLVAQATLTLTASTLATNPLTAGAAIGIGIAAIAIGSAISSIAKSGPFSSGGGGGITSGGSGGRTNFSSPSAQPGPQQPLRIEVVGTLRGSGKDLVALITAADYRRSRTS